MDTNKYIIKQIENIIRNTNTKCRMCRWRRGGILNQAPEENIRRDADIDPNKYFTQIRIPIQIQIQSAGCADGGEGEYLAKPQRKI